MTFRRSSSRFGRKSTKPSAGATQSKQISDSRECLFMTAFSRVERVTKECIESIFEPIRPKSDRAAAIATGIGPTCSACSRLYRSPCPFPRGSRRERRSTPVSASNNALRASRRAAVYAGRLRAPQDVGVCAPRRPRESLSTRVFTACPRRGAHRRRRRSYFLDGRREYCEPPSTRFRRSVSFLDGRR